MNITNQNSQSRSPVYAGQVSPIKPVPIGPDAYGLGQAGNGSVFPPLITLFACLTVSGMACKITLMSG